LQSLRTIVLAVCSGLLAIPLAAQVPDSAFVGTWELASIEAPAEAGGWEPAALPIAGRPVGVIMYDALGNMAVQITGDPRSVETPEEQPEIVNGYVAYYARYEVDAAAGTVTHHRRSHVNPALANLSVVRYYEFSGDTLTLTIAPDRSLRLKWARQR
jgi:hypothetical protein